MTAAYIMIPYLLNRHVVESKKASAYFKFMAYTARDVPSFSAPPSWKIYLLNFLWVLLPLIFVKQLQNSSRVWSRNRHHFISIHTRWPFSHWTTCNLHDLQLTTQWKIYVRLGSLFSRPGYYRAHIDCAADLETTISRTWRPLLPSNFPNPDTVGAPLIPLVEKCSSPVRNSEFRVGMTNVYPPPTFRHFFGCDELKPYMKKGVFVLIPDE